MPGNQESRHQNVQQGHGQQELPTEAHQLVIAEARQCSTHPDIKKHEAKKLSEVFYLVKFIPNNNKSKVYVNYDKFKNFYPEICIENFPSYDSQTEKTSQKSEIYRIFSSNNENNNGSLLPPKC